MGLIFCGLAFVVAVVAAWRSTIVGLWVVLATGYLFGILRANYLDTYSHFLADAAVIGFYLSFFSKNWPRPRNASEAGAVKWTGILVGWAGLMFLIPIQHPLIQLVGLRGNAFLVPFLIVGSRLNDRDGRDLAVGLAWLNLMAFFFAIAEFLLGVPAFYPENSVTEIIYKSQDIAGATAFRIPACFSNAHNYAGTMVLTIPWLIGACMQRQESSGRRLILAAGIFAAMVGVFMTGTRTFNIQLFLLMIVITFSGKMNALLWIGWALMLGGLGYLVSGEERMQRFMTLQNTDEVIQRVEGSVNMGFVDLLTTYPLGNGLGGGGTSIPFFLQHLISDPVMMENEYCRIMLEEGVVGLALWLAFFFWLLSRSAPKGQAPWSLGWRLVWVICLSNIVLATLGTGLMTAIPQTSLCFLSMGFLLGPRTAAPKTNPALAKSVRPIAPQESPQPVTSAI
jgi:hypothetical protein